MAEVRSSRGRPNSIALNSSVLKEKADKNDSPRASKTPSKEFLSPKLKPESKERRLQMHLSCISELARLNTDLSTMEEQVLEFQKARSRASNAAATRPLSAVPLSRVDRATSPTKDAESRSRNRRNDSKSPTERRAGAGKSGDESGQTLSDLSKRFYWPQDSDSGLLFGVNHRVFVREAKFQKKSFKPERNVKDEYLFLFNDILILARPSFYLNESQNPSGEKLLVMKSIVPLNHCFVWELQDTEAKRNYSFEVVRICGKGSRRLMTISTSSLEEKTLWLNLITDAALRFPYSNFYFEDSLLCEL